MIMQPALVLQPFNVLDEGIFKERLLNYKRRNKTGKIRFFPCSIELSPIFMFRLPLTPTNVFDMDSKFNNRRYTEEEIRKFGILDSFCRTQRQTYSEILMLIPINLHGPAKLIRLMGPENSHRFKLGLLAQFAR